MPDKFDQLACVLWPQLVREAGEIGAFPTYMLAAALREAHTAARTQAIDDVRAVLRPVDAALMALASPHKGGE